MKKLTMSLLSVAVMTGFVSVAAANYVDGGGASVAPDKALQNLMDGNSRFSSGKSTYPHSNEARRTEVAKTQKPFATILTCADSRLSPELIFDQGIGDIFVARVAGNTFGKDILGSIEYSVAVLGSRLVVVMGHERCGAVDAAIKGGTLPGSIGNAVAPIKPAVLATKSVKTDRLGKTIEVNAELQAKKLVSRSKILRDLVKKGELKVVAATYDLDSGAVKLLK